MGLRPGRICPASQGQRTVIGWSDELDQRPKLECDRRMNTSSSVDPRELPTACTLGPHDGAERMRRWRALVNSGNPIATDDGPVLEIRFRPDAAMPGELAWLAAAEQDCCAFVTWTVVEDDGNPVLRIVANPNRPDDVAAIAALFGAR